jgi:hypothetical protein
MSCGNKFLKSGRCTYSARSNSNIGLYMFLHYVSDIILYYMTPYYVMLLHYVMICRVMSHRAVCRACCCASPPCRLLRHVVVIVVSSRRRFVSPPCRLHHRFVSAAILLLCCTQVARVDYSFAMNAKKENFLSCSLRWFAFNFCVAITFLQTNYLIM